MFKGHYKAADRSIVGHTLHINVPSRNITGNSKQLVTQVTLWHSMAWRVKTSQLLTYQGHTKIQSELSSRPVRKYWPKHMNEDRRGTTYGKGWQHREHWSR